MKRIRQHLTDPVVDSCLVMPKGATKGTMARAALGPAGSAVTAASDTIADHHGAARSPLRGGPGTLGLVALTVDEVVLLDGRRGALRPVATGVAARVPRTELAGAELGKGRLSSPLTLRWSDGSSWELEVPRANVKDARRLVDAASVIGALA